MEKPYFINVRSMMRTDKLGEEFNLPYSKELDEAVLLINRLCGQLVREKEINEYFMDMLDED